MYIDENGNSDMSPSGNNIQLKLKVNEFIKEMAQFKIGQYAI